MVHRMAAGLSMKNSLVAKDADRHALQVARWEALDPAVRTQVKQLVLQALTSGHGQVGTAAAQMVSAIAFIDLPRGQWPELMASLLAAVTTPGSAPGLRKASLEAIGFICEEIDPGVLESSSANVLTAVVNGLRKDEPSVAVRVAAAKALLNAAAFIRRHIETPTEAVIIMQVVCEAAASSDESLAVAAFECLNELVRLYYERMGPFLGEGVSQMAIAVLARGSPDAVVLQAIEYWSTLGEIERELELDAGPDGASDSFYFCRRSAADLLPPLLRLLETQPGEDTVDEWCPSMAAATCLGLVAEALGDEILSGSAGAALRAFVEQRLAGSGSWRAREAGIMALGSILDGPQGGVVGPLVSGQLSRLVELLAHDQSVAVQDSAAWALGRICDFHLDVVPPAHVPILLQVLQHCLVYAPRVAVNCAWSLLTLCTHLGAEDDSVPTSPVSGPFESLTAALLQAADRADADEAGLRSAAYQALAGLVLNAPADRLPAVRTLTLTSIGRLEQSIAALGTAVVNADDRNRLFTLQAHLSTVLQASIRKAGAPDHVAMDRLVQCLHALLAITDAGAELEDALLLAGVLLGEVDGTAAARYAPALLPGLCSALGRLEEAQLCGVAVGVVGDLARALGPQLAPHAERLVALLVTGLTAPVLQRAVKPHIVSALGDICLALGPDPFLPYLSVVMNLLVQASAVSVADPEDYDEVDWVAALRESLLEAYTCMVQTLRPDSMAGQALTAFLPAILAFLQTVAADPERSEATVRAIGGLLGDLAEAFGPQVRPHLLASPWVMAFFKAPLADTQQAPSPQTIQILQWAHQMLTK